MLFSRLLCVPFRVPQSLIWAKSHRFFVFPSRTFQIEVVKTRAQVESSASSPNGKLGSFRIASMIAKKEGLRGFYVGGLMTSIHDGVSSGIFFATCMPYPTLSRSLDQNFH